MQPFSILMFIFSSALLLYAGLLGLSKSVSLIPRSYAATIKDRRLYAVTVAKMVAVAALAPLGAGIYALFSMRLGAIAIVVNLPLCIWLGYCLFGDAIK